MTLTNPSSNTAFIVTGLRTLCGLHNGGAVLDFGCGRGELVRDLCLDGFDAWGCDNGAWRGGDYTPDQRMLEIGQSPYRLPFPDNHFDAVVSTTVMEHAQNKHEVFSEIWRVLKPGGTMLHLFPSKWYLPLEPHIYVPLVSWMWPHVPYWWLALWAILGVRNEYQHGFSWRQTADANLEYCRSGLHYWSARQYRRALGKSFGNCVFPYRFYLDHAPGGAARFGRLLPGKPLVAWLLGHVRITLVSATKRQQSVANSL